MRIASSPTDEATFARLSERHRWEIEVHCRRVLGPHEDPEDAVQETFLRAWRSRSQVRDQTAFRAWLYRIATNACLDARRPRAAARRRMAEWDEEADARSAATVATGAEPERRLFARASTERAFMATIRHLTPSERAALIIRSILEFPARDAASALDCSVASFNSALQRARSNLQRRIHEPHLEWVAGQDPTPAERELLERYVDAVDRADTTALLEVLLEDSSK
jgi:RNA polymerase sigma-70 factor, ECF subfamily